MIIFLGRGNKEDIFSIGHDEHQLSRVSPLIRMDQNVLKPAFLDHQDNFLKRDATTRLQTLVLVGVPAKRLHMASLAGCVPFVISSACGGSVTSNVNSMG